MDRRKFLIGMGSVAAGGAAAMGTGAFDKVSADRTVDIEVVDDANAYLQLTPSNSPNGEYARVQGDGTININLDNSDDGGGAGLNKYSETDIGKIVEVKNQGTQRVRVYVPWQDQGNGQVGVTDRVSADADEDGDREFAKFGSNGDTDDGVRNDIYMDVVTPRGGGKSLTGIYGVKSPSDKYFADMEVGPGNSMQLGLFIRVKNPPSSLDATFDITADADLV